MSVFVNVDAQGRIVLPKSIRQIFQTNKFSVSVPNKEKIVFVPVKSIDEICGSMPNLNMKKLEEEHNKER